MLFLGYPTSCERHYCKEDDPGIMSSWRWCWQRSIILRPLYTLAALPLLLLLLLPPARPVPISIDHPSPHSIPPHPHAFFLTINKPRTILEMPISLIDNIFPIRSSMIAPFGETVKASCRDILCFNLYNHSSLALKLSILVLMSLII